MDGIDWLRLRAKGVQSGLTVDSTATGITLTPTANETVKAAVVTCFTAAIRFWTNGTAPTTTTGHRADIYDQIELYGDEVANFKAIRESSTSASLEVTYYG